MNRIPLSTLPPGCTDRDVAEHGTHDMERCAGCGRLHFAAVLDETGLCAKCADPAESLHSTTLDPKSPDNTTRH